MDRQKNTLTPEQRDDLLKKLRQRFDDNMDRHAELTWTEVVERLKKHDQKLWSLHEMEKTGGEPDVIGYDREQDTYLFCDCAAESPDGRRSLCYDREALDARKKNPPADSAVGMAETMGIDLLSEDQYRDLQKLGSFDTKTSSWVKTPASIRAQGGAIFCDRRYDTVFVFHNGADSYYASRGFRGLLRI